MAAFNTVETVPLTTDQDGIVRVSGTRVTLDTIVASFRDGATPEEIAQQYPSLSLADVYQVLAYCLRHTREIQAYLDERIEDSNSVRAENEKRWPPEGVRDRLTARRLK